MFERKDKSAVSIIGGADGPTSVFVVGPHDKKTFRTKVRDNIYKNKRRKAAGKIYAEPHTLKELVKYAEDNYDLAEVDFEDERYIEQRNGAKESFILRYKPELLGDMRDIERPDMTDEESVKDFFAKIKARSDMAAKIPDSEIPMDFHIYEIRIDGGLLEMEIDYIWNEFGISYSGDKKAVKCLQKISKDLYIYYGVSEEDIEEKTERYSALLVALSE